MRRLSTHFDKQNMHIGLCFKKASGLGLMLIGIWATSIASWLGALSFIHTNTQTDTTLLQSSFDTERKHSQEQIWLSLLAITMCKVRFSHDNECCDRYCHLQLVVWCQSATMRMLLQSMQHASDMHHARKQIQTSWLLVAGPSHVKKRVSHYSYRVVLTTAAAAREPTR